ncbi:1-phosphofructokinase family hexose kinase [Glycomyces sp. TRM65418]|uniref:1-phosphofructokinase family hexose kinase n=1 Tax=Glycomyces sp. TRM65418 TaxID=2867006 RepID=UPI001CE5BEC7|nr:1-phosphofructokinase family hexose kinase [Glycomyces sp. TRM65418]MCC3763128.1 1-phosphofructokinase family hexose kinase [Glycomyces sp. TRM65418]QZD57135.1 1-phosphofructokinase family hexose kinase [Glycomyces sp. TRM65418]
MIVTVTANPSLDRTIEVPRLRRGEVQRAAGIRVDPGGKGVNVSRALVAHGRATRAVLTTGGHAGTELIDLLAEAGVPVIDVPVSRSIRSNLTIAEADGTVTKLNEAGPALRAEEIEELLAAAIAAPPNYDEQSPSSSIDRPTAWIAGCGSLPPGVGADFYADLVERAHDAGAKAAVDTSGPALDACLAARPDLVKPNLDELAEAARVPIRTLGDAVAAAEALRAAGAAAVLASLGPDGAILVDHTGVTHARAPLAGSVASTVGAGDAALAGFLAAGGRGPEALTAAVAWGTAAVSLPGSIMPAPDDIDLDAVVVTRSPDHGRVLS